MVFSRKKSSLRLRSLPLEIAVLSVFSLVWTIFFSVLPLVNYSFYREIIPLVGTYPFLKYIWVFLALAFTSYFYPSQNTKRGNRKMALIGLIVVSIWGIVGLWETEYGAIYSVKPSDIYSPLRPIFHNLIPMFWVILIGLKLSFTK